MQITYEMNWDASNEFNSEYYLQVNFDPDLYADGNTKNDDKLSSNNRKKLPAVQIDAVVIAGIIPGG